MWQQCPNCKGSGTTFYPLSHSTSAVCTVCKGYKIISELTGLPPISESVKVVSKNTQDADLELIAVPVTYVIADGSSEYPKYYCEHESSFGGDISTATTFATEQLAKDFIVASDWSEWAYVEEN